MARLLLDRIHRTAPGRAFQRALSCKPVDADAYGFLLDHADELELPVVQQCLRCEVASDVDVQRGPFLRRMVTLLEGPWREKICDIQDSLELSDRIDPEEWIHGLTIPLMGKIEDWLWYRFVDKARGGELFNALNAGMPADPRHPEWEPEQSISEYFEMRRPRPLVAGILERAHDDFDVAAFALSAAPVGVLLQLNARFPSRVSQPAIEGILSERVIRDADDWLPPNAAEGMPSWMEHWIVKRLGNCGEAEARGLYQWLFTDPRRVEVDPFKLALLRYRISVSGVQLGDAWQYWASILAKHLVTGTAWKSNGKELIGSCIERGRGFPMSVLTESLALVREEHGATKEERQRSILRRVHDETAQLLVRYAERALNQGEQATASLYLSAFMSLDPGSFISGALHKLGKRPGLTAELASKIEACEALAGAGHREPSADAINEVFCVLTRQVP